MTFFWISNFRVSDVSFQTSHNLVKCEVSICYGVATISRLLETIGLFCKRAL